MKKLWVSLFLIFIMFALFGQSSITDRPVAVVKLHKTEVLPKTKFQRYEKTMMLQKQGAPLTMEEKKTLLDVLINQILVRQDAEKLGITVKEENVIPAAMQTLSLELQQAKQIPAGAVLTDPEQFKQLLVQNGYDYELYLENARNSMLIEMYVTQTKRAEFENMSDPALADIENFYNQNITQFVQPEHVMISQIFFSLTETSDKTAVKNKADDLYKKITSGTFSFDEKAKSEGDNFPYTQMKGQKFTIAKADKQAINLFGESFTNSLFSNKTTGHIYLLESKIGFHIVKLESYNEAHILSLNDKVTPLQEMTVLDYLTQMMRGQMQQQLYLQLQQQVVIDLRKRAEINTFEDAL
jgi:hypothetical protein